MILFNQDLMELLKQFYVLTGMRIVLFDTDGIEIASCPDNDSPLCSHMKKNAEFKKKCIECERKHFNLCRKNLSLTSYKCHAGFIEAISPLIQDGRVIGYMMFGQIADSKEKADFSEKIRINCASYGENNVDEFIKKIKFKSNKHIEAASKILDAITSYILLKEMVHPKGKQLIDKIDKFVEQHLDEEITVERLCTEFNISRSRLYDSVNSLVGGGIASYIRKKRLGKAKNLVKNTNMPYADIAYSIGFNDYNYFLRVFKKEFGISPKKMRLSIQE